MSNKSKRNKRLPNTLLVNKLLRRANQRAKIRNKSHVQVLSLFEAIVSTLPNGVIVGCIQEARRRIKMDKKEIDRARNSAQSRHVAIH